MASPGKYSTATGDFAGDLDPVNTAEKIPRWASKGSFTSKGFAQLTVTTSSTALSTVSGGIPTGSVFCLVDFEGDVRWRDDSTAPTASVGMRQYDGDTRFFDCADLTKLKFIAVSGSAVLNITFYA